MRLNRIFQNKCSSITEERKRTTFGPVWDNGLKPTKEEGPQVIFSNEPVGIDCLDIFELRKGVLLRGWMILPTYTLN